ncbi:MAG TPA: hypothetical protein VM029_18125, partial [Opitutaceae bacterium]|nr:hypothetical protein [Opitutaceae bacterium]
LLQPSRILVDPRAAESKTTLVAIDSSRSMRQMDAGGRARLEAARALVWDAGIASREGGTLLSEIRLMHFDTDAAPVTGSLTNLHADGPTTRFHQSVQTMLGSLPPGQGAHALFLLTDGHDFELVNAAQTALAARTRRVPIYAVAFGGDRQARDVSVRITSYQPFHYVKQTIRLNASIRPLGAPDETLEVTLLREGREVKRQNVVVRDEASVTTSFEVTEPGAGQFEYAIRVTPLTGEAETSNNTVTTYLNVIDRKLRVLVLEGRPYWDTTFLQRSLRRNDKLEVDVVSGYAKGRFHVIRTDGDQNSFKLPADAPGWNGYDAIILGQAVDQLLTAAQLAALDQSVDQLGVVVIFARGDAVSGTGQLDRLQPVTWGQTQRATVAVKVAPDGRGTAPFRLLAEAGANDAALPPLLGRRSQAAPKSLSAAMAVADDDAAFPAFVHRRYGSGQVLSVGVDGLWRWAFNAKTEGANTVFDRFWDQTLLWLVNSRDVLPGSRYTFRASTANVLLGEKLYLRIVQRQMDGPKPAPLKPLALTVRHGDAELTRIMAGPHLDADAQRLFADYVPEQTGPYRIEARLPDGTTQTVRFNVYEDNAEASEVAADPAYLRRLTEASGGRVLKPEEFAATLKRVQSAPVTAGSDTHLEPAWPVAWVCWLLGIIGATDWFLRRRWGLA